MLNTARSTAMMLSSASSHTDLYDVRHSTDKVRFVLPKLATSSLIAVTLVFVSRRYVLRLHESDGFEDMGGVSLKNAVCLFFAWLLIFACLMKGVKSSGKVCFYTFNSEYINVLA